MTVAVANPIVSYVAAGVGPYSVPFPYADASHLKVIARSSAGADTNPAFTVGALGVTLAAAPSAGSVIIYRDTPEDQILALSDLAAFPAKAVESALDRLMLIAQEAARDFGGSVRGAPGEALPALPPAAARALRVLGFDVAGNPSLVGPPDALAATLPLLNIATLRAAVWPTGRPAQVYLTNNWVAGDGGGIFRWDATSVAADNGGTILKEAAVTVGRWIRQTIEPTNPKWFGARGDGVTNDSAAFTAMLATNPVSIFIPAGTYLLNPGTFTGLSNQGVRGAGRGVTILRAASGGAAAIVTYNGRSNFFWSDLTIDWNNQVETDVNGALSLFNSTDFSFEIDVINIDKFGFAMNWVRRFVLSKCKIRRAAKASTQNQAILISSFSGQSEFGLVEGNYCENSAINYEGRNLKVSQNFINGFSFGAGITSEQELSKCRNNEIVDNTITDGTGVDVNVYRCGGIENWDWFTIVARNTVYSNDGAGIDAGGYFGVYDSNIVYDNGRGLTTFPGISARYGTATYNASGSLFINNKVFNQNGASGPQAYGYSEQSSLLYDIRLSNNHLSGNRTGPMNALSATTTISDPALQGSAAWDPGSIANGAGQTVDIFVNGARVGDMVNISFSLDTQGLTASGWVNASNNVRGRLFNSTGAAVDLAAGTAFASVTKRINYAEYR